MGVVLIDELVGGVGDFFVFLVVDVVVGVEYCEVGVVIDG